GNDPPELGSPFSAPRRRPRWWAYVVAPAVAGVIAAGVLTRPKIGEPKIGLVVAGAVLLILLVRHLRWLVSLPAIGLVAATADYTVKHQSLFHFPAGGWPINFEPASELAWGAVVLLAVDAIIEMARGGTRVAPPTPDAELTDSSSPDPVVLADPFTGVASADPAETDVGTVDDMSCGDSAVSPDGGDNRDGGAGDPSAVDVSTESTLEPPLPEQPDPDSTSHADSTVDETVSNEVEGAELLSDPAATDEPGSDVPASDQTAADEAGTQDEAPEGSADNAVDGAQQGSGLTDTPPGQAPEDEQQ
ncbi:MAG TPA: hypothetical protein VNC61_13920, partial [Acidimicrobiales bacterium]|nr:hypothetical protein [Acidimicrobiales bacterium]